MPTESTSAAPLEFRAAFEQSIQRLRGALTELYGSVSADPRAPQRVSRQFGINRNLAWKIGKIIHAPDAAHAYPHLPGQGSFDILLKAFATAGAPESAQLKVRSALREYDVVVERHAGDRATLELMVGSMGLDPDEGPLSETSRKLAFQGNSAIWGAQARVRMLVQIIAPNREHPLLLDNAMVGGVLDYRRLRPGVTWPLGQRIIASHGAAPSEAYIEPIAADADADDDLPLMREFCSSPIPALRNVREGELTITELCEGPVGNTGSLSCVFGWIHRQYAAVYREEDDIYHEHVLRLDTPAEVAMLDLLVHRDLPYAMPPRLCLYSMMHGRLNLPLCTHPQHHLPCGEPVQDLGNGPPVLATPHVARYPEMVQRATERLGRDLSEFHGFRFTMKYPPIPTIADLYYEKPTGKP